MNTVLETFLNFLYLGATVFGGPAAHIAAFEIEFVEKKKWLSAERFRELMGTAALIPGPTSTELALLIGMERAGLTGLMAAGVGFIFPAFAVTLVIAQFIAQHGLTPEFLRVMHGLQPVLIAVIFHALFKLIPAVFKAPFLYVCALVALVVGYLDFNILLVLFGAGVLNMLWLRMTTNSRKNTAGAAGLMAMLGASERKLSAAEAGVAAATGVAVVASTPSVLALLGIFVKIGAVFYGGGYVLMEFLRKDFVVSMKVLTERDLLIAISIGQVTPGPLFTAATYVGFTLQGIAGAVAATVGIFAPAFLYAALSGAFVPVLRRSKAVMDVLDGVNAGSWAMMALVAWYLGREAVVDWRTALIALLSAAILFTTKINSAWLVLAGALIGYFLL